MQINPYVSSVNLATWRQLLIDAQPAAGPHPWICATQREGQPFQIQLLTTEEYNNFFNRGNVFYKLVSYFRDTCRKLTIEEMVAVSQRHMPERDYANWKVRFVFATAQVFSTTTASELWKVLHGIQSSKRQCEMIPIVLRKMNQRAHDKRVVTRKTDTLWNRIKSVWAQIQWEIWNRFFNQNKAITTLSKESVPNIEEACKAAINGIQFHTLVNMKLFEEALQIPAEQRTSIHSDQFNTLKDVRMKWLARYAPDKTTNLTVSEENDVYRTRVYTLLQLWQDLLKFELHTKTSQVPSSRETPLIEWHPGHGSLE